MDVAGKRVYVGLSGGVDSAVSAALLQRSGASVTGVFIKGWYPPGMPCTWAAERRDAMRVAVRLRIPFRTFDASVEYKKEVIDYLLAEYRAGRTPNPDVMCNREVKFGAFYRYAMEQGADSIAMGHYLGGEKDQRYFLWAVPRDVWAKTLFPVGHMEKSAVRVLAKQFDLPVAKKPDSQGICFLGSVSVKEFLRSEIGDNPAILHTIGERVPGGYVVGKDVVTGEVEVAPTPRSTQEIRFTNENRLGSWEGPLTVQYRYHGPRVPGSIPNIGCPTSNVGHPMSYIFESNEPLLETPAPGQSIVFYRGDELVGGGIID